MVDQQSVSFTCPSDWERINYCYSKNTIIDAIDTLPEYGPIKLKIIRDPKVHFVDKMNSDPSRLFIVESQTIATG